MNKKRWFSALLIISVLAIAFFWGGDYQKSSTEIADGTTKTEDTSEITTSPNMVLQQDEEANRLEDTTTKESDSNASKPLTEELQKSEEIESDIESGKVNEVAKGTEKGPETEKVVEPDKPVVKVEESDMVVIKQPVKDTVPQLKAQESKKPTVSKSEVKVPNTEAKKDKYLTDPVPKGKPKPVEWQDATINKKEELTVTLSVSATTILNNMDTFNKDKLEVLPADGIIYKKQKVTFYEGESVFAVLLREMKKNKIHMEFSMTPIYNSNYIEGINNLYEFDCGELSGWMYKVNGWFPNYGSSRYVLKDGDVVDWVYTCDLGRDVGGDMGAGKQ
ncbi:DUF4430 domain-containing protein [Paenibacillus macquariensis]|uniref:Transcobalamin-like C-terminal domain-containing protein n=1 Tax=Paenibacillus macquariensis TaxID=948756 RepID=A0ABY1JXW5_9BACL|nr:DUF4430 domain-containing protein [Paenibacillus macquariensis]MEC0089238.1 DUF4430 domain-containing protein [Paenibacillus macquariensis]OAB33349.1 hypothetical protein PMSM_15195 [Paenibacillus macquariensis subsp. macquariensis]SIQ95810.1 protein of unknown function [Paenibacillus macquariensis]